MTTKYAILNPHVGGYVIVSSLDEAASTIGRIALEFYIAHSHDTPITVVTTDENGVETWTAPDGTMLMSPQQMEEYNEQAVKRALSFIEAQRIPVTTL